MGEIMQELKDVIEIHNGNQVTNTFNAAEYASRLAKLRTHMVDAQIDHVLFSSYQNINYYSDFLYYSFGRFYALVVDHDKQTSLSANIDGAQPWRRTVGDNLIYTDWTRDNYFKALQQLIKDGGRIGIEFDNMTLQNMGELKTAFPKSEFVDVSVACMQMRMIKSDAEIALIKHGAQVADIGGAACAEAIAPGVPEHEIAIHSTNAMIREIAKRFPDSELRDTWTWFQSGINTDGAHNPVTTKKIERGDILSVNCFPMISGYYTALERTLFSEEVSDAHLKLWEINVQVHERGIELIQPGAKCCDIALELNEIYREHGILDRRTFGYGHSFGVLSHYYGREAGLELREDIDTVLEPNMVISMEPMIMIPEGEPGAGGYREHDILVVGEDGSENITGFPYGPEKNVIKN
jgi:creatinase